MRAMLLTKESKTLLLKNIEKPIPNRAQALIKVCACGVCRTDLHILDGELPAPKLPLVLGHQIVGIVEECEDKALLNKMVGVPWLGGSCGQCSYCLSGRENLCDSALYTGYQIDGGYAEYCVADRSFIFPIPHGFSASQAAPLLCAGLIGYRCLRFTEGAKRIGFFGFGSSAHLLVQVVNYRGGQVFAFTKKGDTARQAHAKKLGAYWAGDSCEMPDEPLDAAIIFAPVGELVPQALKTVKKGGIVVCGGIHMSDIPSFPYHILWQERRLCSVANLTRQDGEEFLKLAASIPLTCETTLYPLEELNRALDDLRQGKITGTAVIQMVNSKI